MKQPTKSQTRTSENYSIRRDVKVGPTNYSNYFFAGVAIVSSCRFLITGISSWKQENIISFVDITDIQFIPQGITMCFYGRLGFRLGSYLFAKIYLGIGSGFNEYGTTVFIFRRGYPGTNRNITSCYSVRDCETLYLENERRLIRPDVLSVSLSLKGRSKIIIAQVGEAGIYSIREIEDFASDLAKILNLPLTRKLI